MKKIYNSPSIETLEMHFAYKICDPSANKSIDDNSGSNMFPPAPKRTSPF